MTNLCQPLDFIAALVYTLSVGIILCAIPSSSTCSLLLPFPSMALVEKILPSSFFPIDRLLLLSLLSFSLIRIIKSRH